jgi:hypothetical protein
VRASVAYEGRLATCTACAAWFVGARSACSFATSASRLVTPAQFRDRRASSRLGTGTAAPFVSATCRNVRARCGNFTARAFRVVRRAVHALAAADHQSQNRPINASVHLLRPTGKVERCRPALPAIGQISRLKPMWATASARVAPPLFGAVLYARMAFRLSGDPRCRNCSDDHEPGRARCAACAEKHRLKMRRRNRYLISNGLCVVCSAKVAADRRFAEHRRLTSLCRKHQSYYAERAARVAAL